MRRPRPLIEQRKAVFFGCEGQSEVGYASFLKDVLNEAGLHIHIDARSLSPGAGDPNALIQSAIKEMRQRERRRIPYFYKVVLIDIDRLDGNDHAKRSLERTASENGMNIIWQIPCHEATLLRHLENCEQLCPATTAIAHSELKRRWPEYQKPMSRTQLHKRLDLAGVRRVAAVDDGLQRLLARLGLQT